MEIRKKEFSSKKKGFPVVGFDSVLLSSVAEKFAYYSGGVVDRRISKIEAFTEYKKGEIIYRSHPSFRSGDRWNDWAYICWENKDTDADPEVFEGQLLLFLDIGSIKYEEYPILTNPAQRRRCDVIESQFLAIVHSSSGDDTDMSSPNRKNNIYSYSTMESVVHIVDCKCIEAPCFTVTNKSAKIGQHMRPSNITTVVDPSQWAEIFTEIWI